MVAALTGLDRHWQHQRSQADEPSNRQKIAPLPWTDQSMLRFMVNVSVFNLNFQWVLVGPRSVAAPLYRHRGWSRVVECRAAEALPREANPPLRLLEVEHGDIAVGVQSRGISLRDVPASLVARTSRTRQTARRSGSP